MSLTTILPALPAPAPVALLGPCWTHVDEAVLAEYAEGLRLDGYAVSSAWDLDGLPSSLDRWRAAVAVLVDADAVVLVPGWEWDPHTVDLLEVAAALALPVVEFDPQTTTFVAVALFRGVL